MSPRPIPARLLVSCLDILLPVITKIVNLSLQTGQFPNQWKTAIINPLLKKRGVAPIFQNLRPISNLAFISKLTERIVANQTQRYMTENKLYPLLKSEYRKNHSTETALLKVKNDLLLNMDKSHVSLLVLLDLSAAFDTVDHDILLRRLREKLGLTGTALTWFSSYLTGRQQKVSMNGTFSDLFELKSGVPQGSCLGPLLFTIYASKLFEVIESHLPNAHAYADDTQLYISFNPNDNTNRDSAITAIQLCVQDLRLWMTRDRLMLNSEKTEIILFGTPQQLKKVNITKINICEAAIYPADVVKDLGVWFNSSLTMTTHINKISASAFFYLYNIRHIRKFLSRQHTDISFTPLLLAGSTTVTVFFMACLIHPFASTRESRKPAPALSTAPPTSATSHLF